MLDGLRRIGTFLIIASYRILLLIYLHVGYVARLSHWANNKNVLAKYNNNRLMGMHIKTAQRRTII